MDENLISFSDNLCSLLLRFFVFTSKKYYTAFGPKWTAYTSKIKSKKHMIKVLCGLLGYESNWHWRKLKITLLANEGCVFLDNKNHQISIYRLYLLKIKFLINCTFNFLRWGMFWIFSYLVNLFQRINSWFYHFLFTVRTSDVLLSRHHISCSGLWERRHCNQACQSWSRFVQERMCKTQLQ